MGSKDTPNSSTNMDIEIKVNAASLRDLLDHVNVNNAIDPVKVMFTEDGATVWAHDANKTLQVFVDDFEMTDYTLKSDPGCVILETKKVAEMIGAKFGKEKITLKATPGEPVVMSRNGSTLSYFPPSEDECYVVPDHWVLPVDDDGTLLFPMLENAPATLRVSMHPDELKKALTDMRVAGSTYACITFGKESVSESGHWNSKGNRSKSPVEATIISGEGEVTFPEVLSSVVDRMGGELLEVQKHEGAPFFMLISGSTRILVTEAQRADNA